MVFGSLKPSYGELLLPLALLIRRNPRCFYCLVVGQLIWAEGHAGSGPV